MQDDITVRLGNFLSWDNAEEAIREIELLRLMVADWEQTARMLAMDLGSINLATKLHDDIASGLYEKVRERLKSGD